ncbi:MAG: alpha/beta hydrolase [Cyanobacteria bacterium P01_A01_bin.3]
MSVLLAAAIAIGVAGQAHAAEELVITAGPATRTVQIDELALYAETGETSRQLQVYFDEYVGEEGAKGIRKALNLTLQVDFVPFTRYLRSEGGSCFLGQVSRMLRPATSNIDATQALRAGLINSAAPDGNMSLIEFFQTYPNRQIYIDQEQLSGSGEESDALRSMFREVLVASGLPLEEGGEGFEVIDSNPDDEFSGLVIPLTDVDYELLAENSVDMICGARFQQDES